MPTYTGLAIIAAMCVGVTSLTAPTAHADDLLEPPSPSGGVSSDEAELDADPPSPGIDIPDIPLDRPSQEQLERELATETTGVFVDAMVGQINGRPVYASTIFDHVGDDVLQRLGREQSRSEFHRTVRQLIQGAIMERVLNTLYLAEAEKELGEQERRQLRGFIQMQRERILAQHLGSAARAERALQERRGHGIDQELRHIRESVLIDQYRRRQVMSQVVVNRRDVERFYRDNYNEFNEPSVLQLRVIIVSSEQTADSVAEALAAGEDFADVAAEYTEVRARQQGRMPEIRLHGRLDEFQETPWDAVNAAVQQMRRAGQQSDRIALDDGAFAWVRIDSLEGGNQRELKEVFLEIERRIGAAREDQVMRRLHERMLREGNFTPIEQMTSALVEVAMSRYAPPE